MRKQLSPVSERAIAILPPVETAVFTLAIAAFWFADFNRVFALGLLFIPIMLRLIAYGRPYLKIPLLPLIALFFIVAGIGIAFAPYAWGMVTIGRPAFALLIDYDLIALGRPLLGALLALTLADHIGRHGLRGVLMLTGILCAGIALLALAGSQWTEKSAAFRGLLPALPVITAPDFRFNVNEIGGALTWAAPLLAGLIALVATRPATQAGRVTGRRVLVIAAWIAFGVLLFALILGQSRLAIIGIVIGLVIVARFGLPAGRRRWLAYAGVAALIGVQGVVQSGVLVEDGGAALVERDQGSLTGRLVIYYAGYSIVRDHALTGAGINTFRSPPVREAYPVPGWEVRVLPHAHNAFLQVAVDLGVPGAVWYGMLHIAAALMLIQTWRRGDTAMRTAAAAVGGALIAHTIYGLGDAITLWDRFAFVFWWVIGLAAGLYARVTRSAVHMPALVDSGAVVHRQADAVQ